MKHEIVLVIETESLEALMDLQGKIAYTIRKVTDDANAKFTVTRLGISPIEEGK